jgi:CRISPR-associated protein Cas5d
VRAQRNMLALADVEYLIIAEICPTKKHSKHPLGVYIKEVQRRAHKGKCYHRPGLGCREFAADFDWVDNPSEIKLTNWQEEDLGIMLYDVFDPAKRSVADEKTPHVKPMPVFFRAIIKDAIMDCHPDRITVLRPQIKGVE